MRFHPKRRASSDQAPGPSSARAAPRVPSRIIVDWSPDRVRALHSSKPATSAPAMGVHRPPRRSIPPPIESTARMVCSIGGPARRLLRPWAISIMPQARRMRRSPAPGPRGRMSRRVAAEESLADNMGRRLRAEAPKGWERDSLEWLEIDNAALQSDRRGMSPVVGAQL